MFAEMNAWPPAIAPPAGADGNHCIARSDEDCASSEACAQYMRCAAKDRVCTGRADLCRESLACFEEGKCSSSSPSIVRGCSAASQEDCLGSDECAVGEPLACGVRGGERR